LPVVKDSPLDLLFHCLSCHANWSSIPVFITSFHPFIHSPLAQTTVSILNLHSSAGFRRFHTVWPPKKKASLLFHGASWQWSGHVLRAIAQAHTARSSRPPYGILLRSHFVSRNKIFHCAHFSMHFRIKFLLFKDLYMFAPCRLFPIGLILHKYIYKHWTQQLQTWVMLYHSSRYSMKAVPQIMVIKNFYPGSFKIPVSKLESV
jgi:hypothetical protein